MAFIGTPLDTRNTFQSLQGKRFNGDGSTTAFTLDVAPSSTLDIEVFVGNVRQDPNSAYTLSGTTLTFTGAPPSGTNNIYVVHQAKSVGTIDPPATETVAKTFSGATTVSGALVASSTAQFDTVGIGAAKDLGVGLHIRTADSGASVATDSDELVIEGSGASGMSVLSGASSNGKIAFNDSGGNSRGAVIYEHDGDNLRFQTAATDALKIDSAGAVTKPLQPAASYRGDAEANLTGDGTEKTIGVTSGAGVTELWDNNADLSGGTFTAPVTGKYLITGQVFIEDIASNHDNMLVTMQTSNRSYYIALNISTLGRASASSFGFPFCAVADMDANDTHVLKLSVSGGSKVIDMVDLFTCQVTLLG